MYGLPRLLVGAVFSLVTLSVMAQDTVWIQGLNYPAWVVRNYQTRALSPGFRLQADDLVRTGQGGRVQIQLADGSAIKLGESARFIVETANLSESQGQRLLQAAFQVLRGAFRFTSSFFKASDPGRRIDVRIGAITAGIRGTDIWGRSNLEQDLLCLIEGEVAVAAEDEPEFNMEQALTFYVKPRGEMALPLAEVDMQQLQRWAEETELDQSAGIAADDGEWQLVLISLTNLEKAEQMLSIYRDQGFAARRVSVQRDGRTLHRLLLPGFVSIDAALNARSQVSRHLDIEDAWVWKAN